MTGSITRGAAAATGLRAGTPVVAGGGDQAANAVGVGAVAPGDGRAVTRDVGRRVRRDDRAALRARTAASTPSATPCPVAGT